MVATCVTILALALFVLLPFGSRFLRRGIDRAVGRVSERAAAISAGTICVCGYDLTATDMARCPECGRVSQFTHTPEELGLTPDELRRLSEAKQRRQRGDA